MHQMHQPDAAANYKVWPVTVTGVSEGRDEWVDVGWKLDGMGGWAVNLQVSISIIHICSVLLTEIMLQCIEC